MSHHHQQEKEISWKQNQKKEEISRTKANWSCIECIMAWIDHLFNDSAVFLYTKNINTKMRMKMKEKMKKPRHHKSEHSHAHTQKAIIPLNWRILKAFDSMKQHLCIQSNSQPNFTCKTYSIIISIREPFARTNTSFDRKSSVHSINCICLFVCSLLATFNLT